VEAANDMVSALPASTAPTICWPMRRVTAITGIDTGEAAEERVREGGRGRGEKREV
jgi:hypothetical protein